LNKISLSILLTSTLAFANETLTINQSIDEVLSHHPKIKSVKQNINIAKSNVDIAVADYLPELSVNLEYNPTKTIALPVNGQFNTIDTDGYRASLILKQKIWDFGKTFNNIEINKLNTDISKYNLKDTKVLLAYQTKLLYEAVFLFQAYMEVKQNDVKVKTELYNQSKEFVKQGLKNKLEESRFLSALYQAKENLNSAFSDFKKYKYTLSLYMGRTLSEDIIFSNTIKELHVNRLSFNNSPGIKSLKTISKQNKIREKSAFNSHFGSLDLKATISRQDSINEYDSSYIGISYNIPIYSGGRISAAEQIARINTLKSKYNIDAKILEITEEQISITTDIQKFDFIIATKKELIKNAQETVDITTARYKEGMATYIEVLDANALYLNAKLGLLQAKFNKNKLIHKQEFLNGEIK